MNQPIDKDYSVELEVNFIPEIQIESWIDTAPEKNVELLKQKSNIQINSYDIKINQSGYLPTVGLVDHMGGI